MSFLHPLLLAALPLVALPIVIHLINQRRYQTVRWAAMMFLLAANKMSRGYARLRQYLIMAARMLAIAGLIFAVSRPLTGGWLGRAGGGKPDTTIILLDRSPSMQDRGGGTGASKLETGRGQLARTLKTLGSGRWVLIDGATNRPRELETIDALLNSPGAEPASASADVPAMMMAAREYIKANNPGRTEVWICSDLRENDWNAEGGRWQTLRDGFREFSQGVRFHLLAYPQATPGNRSVRVTDAHLQKGKDGADLLVSLSLGREGGGDARESVPVQFEIDGARSEVAVELTGAKSELKDYRISLGQGRQKGWGRVSIPADANPADNEFWFSFSPPAPRFTLIVSEDPQAAPPLQLAATISPDPALQCSAEVIGEDGLPAVEWGGVALLLWQAPLPKGDAAKAVKAFVDRGGQAVFFPPREAGQGGELLGASWTSWVDGPEASVETWRGDQDLLANTQSGAALPVGQIQVRKWCGLSGEVTPLATMKGGTPVLARVTTSNGGVYFCATTPAPADSSLATNGVVFYVMIQRALAGGAAVLGSTRQVVAGRAGGEHPSSWKRLAGGDGSAADYAIEGGVYQAGERLLAVNRPAAEDGAPVVSDARVAGLFKGLDFSRVDDKAGNAGSLIQEIWRIFLASMMVAMMVEAGLCMPKARPSTPRTPGAAT